MWDRGYVAHVLPSGPQDDRWTSPAMRLADLEVVLGLDHTLARDWAQGETRTLLGAQIVTRQPVVHALDGPGWEVGLPLIAVAQLTVLAAVHAAGADADNLRTTMINLDHDAGGPVAASRAVHSLLPEALAAAAARYEDASLLAPLFRRRERWGFGPDVADVLDGFNHDEDGWVTEVQLARVGDARIVARAGSCHVLPEGPDAWHAAAVELFRRGRSTQQVASVLSGSVEAVEQAIRERI
jgi:hypothetical protein